MWKRPPISTYLVSMNMVLLGLLFPTFSFLFMREMVQLRDIQLERNITTVRQSLATRSSSLLRSTALSAKESIAGYDFTFLQNLLAEVTHDDPEIRSCMVIDKDQTVVAHSDINQIGSLMTSRSQFPQTLPSGDPQAQIFWPPQGEQGDGGVMVSVFPIYNATSFWGLIRCDYSLASTEREITLVKEDWTRQLGQMRRYFVFLLAGFLLIGLLVAILLTRSFVRATQVLHAGVRQVADGELDRVITLHGGIVCQEFAGLVDSFNTMTEKLRLTHQQLDDYSKSLEEKVEERTRALHEAQEIMVKQAHEAGLAEMAVGVLHNIGNAITPAQVTATVLVNQLTNSPLRTKLLQSLTPLSEFLAGERDLSATEKTRFTSILHYLPSSLVEEYDRAIRELNTIRDKHHHIENIIKLQMRYARVADTPDLVDINRLLRDAMKILADTIAKRQIQVTMELQETPPVRAEATKLLQIMVNLIKNAYEAMDLDTITVRELTVTTGVREGEPRLVFFAVTDTGCGFTEEEKSRLFTFGFSTKERGSGFGLHSCANAIIADHGAIETESPGPGRGATFTVLLPAYQPGEHRLAGSA
jgi:signal transduction histidine kinase